jgi:hypothetical protein
MKKLNIVLISLFSAATYAQEPDPSWDVVTKAVWRTFSTKPHMIDDCALKIAHGIDIDRINGWPAYCNDFEKTSIVVERVVEIKSIIASLNITPADLEKMAQGLVWIGATDQQVMFSWGRPEDVNRTITANRNREQWIYSGGYIYIENGVVTAIQN